MLTSDIFGCIPTRMQINKKLHIYAHTADTQREVLGR